MGRNRAVAGGGLAALLLALLAWWLLRGGAAPVPEPPVEIADPPLPAPEFAPDPVPPAAPVEEAPASAVVRVLDARYGEPAGESLLEAEIVAAPEGPVLAIEDGGRGAWTLRGPRGAVVRVVATAPGFVPAERWLTLGRRPEVPVHLAPVAPVFLRAVAADGGKPVAGASILVSGEPVLFRGRNAARTWRGRTDSDGLVSCPEGGPGRRIRISVHAPGFAFLSMDVEVPPAELLLPLEAAAPRSLRVVDDRKSPLAGVRIRPAGMDGEPLVPPEMAFETDESGLAEIPLPARSPPRARVALVLEAPQRSPRLLVLGEAGKGPDTVALDRPWTGGFTVVDAAGEARAGIPVRVLPLVAAGIPLRRVGGDIETETDARGRVVVADPVPGAAYLASVGGAGELVLASATFPADALRAVPTLAIPPCVPLSVLVEGAGARPLRGAELLLLPPGAWNSPPGEEDRALAAAPAVRTGPAGIAEIRAPAVASDLHASAGPFAWRVAPWDGRAAEVRLAFPAASILVVGVAGANGTPVAGARVRVRPAPAAALPPAIRERASQEAIAGPDGMAVFEVPPGCPLEARADSLGALDAATGESPPLGPGGATLVLRLEEARTTWLAIEGPRGTRLRNASVEVSYEALGSRWLGRGSTGEQGVLAVPTPPPAARKGDARAVFTLLGTERAWGTLPLDGFVDGARVALSPANMDVFLLRIEETPLWPRGTPLRWWALPADPATAPPGGTARVGEECPLPVGRKWKEGILVQLPDSAPVLVPDAKDSERAREVFYDEDPGKSRRPAHPPKADDSASNFEGRLQGPGAPWSFLPLRALDVRNATGGWARARLVLRKGGKPSWTSRPLAPGQSARWLVPTSDEGAVEWEPVRPAR